MTKVSRENGERFLLPEKMMLLYRSFLHKEKMADWRNGADGPERWADKGRGGGRETAAANSRKPVLPTGLRGNDQSTA
ncbi:MAG: hypothetical protein FWF31_04970 [Desulfobulbus sp.]|nr:hypothetical protein [Desulfobulbus sp.]